MERTLAFLLLLVLVGALWWFGGVLARPPRGIGPLEGKELEGHSVVRRSGVGRFKRTRTP